jgi:uncharacterized phiE125 gp8 family phage protein
MLTVTTAATECVFDASGSIVTEAPGAEPVDLAFVKVALSYDFPDLDDQIPLWIATARERFETILGRVFVRQTRQVKLDRFYDAIRLPMPEHSADAVQSVTYIDTSGVEQTLDPSDYRLTAVKSFAGAILRPPRDGSFPDTLCDTEVVTITFECGYAPDGADLTVNVPAVVKSAIIQLVGHMIDQREAYGPKQMFEIPDQCWDLVTPLRVTWFA